MSEPQTNEEELGYVRNCFIKMPSDGVSSALFYKAADGRTIAKLDNMAIIPKQEYYKLEAAFNETQRSKQASFRSNDIARIAYDACNTIAQLLGCARSDEWQNIGGDRQNRMLQLVNNAIRVPELKSNVTDGVYSYSDWFNDILSQTSTNDPTVRKACFKVTVAITKALSSPS